MPNRCIDPLAVLALCLVGRVALASSNVLYLNFADGTEHLTLGDLDIASSNTSQLCEAANLPPWDIASDCANREDCKVVIRDLVLALLAEFDVSVTTERPNAPYTMALIGPEPDSCRFALQGLAVVDCDNANLSNILFAFNCHHSAALCATLIVHEFGHTNGLDHVTNEIDLMSIGIVEGALPGAFVDQMVSTVDSECGLQWQNSYAGMLRALGPAKGSGAPVSTGCHLVAPTNRDTERAKLPFASLIGTAGVVTCLLRRKVIPGF